MDIFQQIGDAIHDFLVNLVGGVFIQIFNEANEQTGLAARCSNEVFQKAHDAHIRENFKIDVTGFPLPVRLEFGYLYDDKEPVKQRHTADSGYDNHVCPVL